MNYETALGFVISLRPRMAVADADAAARRLLQLAGVEGDLEAALRLQDWPKVALLSEPVMAFVREGKKIQAIKEMRTITNIGLREAKEAVEHSTVWNHAPEGSNGFGWAPRPGSDGAS